MLLSSRALGLACLALAAILGVLSILLGGGGHHP
jgi:hypothetical protein